MCDLTSDILHRPSNISHRHLPPVVILAAVSQDPRLTWMLDQVQHDGEAQHDSLCLGERNRENF